jgi:hypothetical protein
MKSRLQLTPQELRRTVVTSGEVPVPAPRRASFADKRRVCVARGCFEYAAPGHKHCHKHIPL